MNTHPGITKENLYQLCIVEGLSTIKAAEKVGASHSAIYQALLRFGITPNNKSTAAKNRWKTDDIDWNYWGEQYKNGSMRLKDISEKIGRTEATTSIQLRKAGFSIRPKGTRLTTVDWSQQLRDHDLRGKTVPDIAREVGCSRKNVTTRFAKIRGRSSAPKPLEEDLICRLYRDEQWSTTKIASHVQSSESGIYACLLRNKIQIRSNEEAAKLQYRHTLRADWPRLAQAYNRKKLNTGEVATIVGCSPSVAADHLRAAGAAVRSKGFGSQKRKELDLDMIQREILEGKSLSAAARERKVSATLVSKRLREIGFYTEKHRKRVPEDQFKRLPRDKREVARALNAVACRICGESRALHMSHIKSDSEGGPMVKENIIPLCSNHNTIMDSKKLTTEEFEIIRPYLVEAKRHGYEHPHYKV